MTAGSDEKGTHSSLRREALAALGDVTGFEQQIHAWADGYRARGRPEGTADYLLYEVVGVEGLDSHVPLTMEQEIADLLRTRWLRFVAGEGEPWKMPSPTALPFNLDEGWKQQVRAAQNLGLNWFMRFISTKSFMPFVIYRIALGIALFVLVGLGVLSPHAGESGL
ncbi:hypothetical protein AMK16_23035 [Streptomyces sp. CB00455]|nr:hypothetical protein AMK16_23035 [Streptomyces sp. CB00455]